MDIASYLIRIITMIGIFSIFAMSLNVAVGWSGLFNLAHIGMAGISAYSFSILVTKYHINFLLAIFLSLVLTAIIAYLLSVVTKKIHGDQFDLLTLFFGTVIYIIFLNWKSVTRGSLGIPGIPQPGILQDDFTMMICILAVSAGVYFFLHLITSSPFGRVLGALRDDELAAQTLGKNTFSLKSKTMVITSVISGIAGICLSLVIRFIDPSTFYLSDLIFVVSAVIIGGLGSLKGSITGVIILFLLTEPLRFFPFPAEILGPLRVIVYSIFLILIILFRPKGIMGKIELE